MLSEADLLITDSNASAETLKDLRAAGIEVIVASSRIISTNTATRKIIESFFVPKFSLSFAGLR